MDSAAGLCRWQRRLMLVLYEDSVSEDVCGIEAHVAVLQWSWLVGGGRCVGG